MTVQHLQRHPPAFLKLHPGRHVTLVPTHPIRRPLLREIQPTIQRALPAAGRVGQEQPDLAVLHLAQPTAPLPRHPARMRPFLGKGARIEHHDPLRIAPRLDHVMTQLRHHRFIIPLAAADKELNRLARHPMFPRDRLGRLTFQPAEQPFHHDPGVVALLLPIEQRHVPLQEALPPPPTAPDLAWASANSDCACGCSRNDIPVSSMVSIPNPSAFPARQL